EPGFEEDRVPAFPVKVESGRVLVNLAAPSRRTKAPHQPHPLSRKPERAPGRLRLAGISTTVMDMTNPRFSGSDYLLDHAVKAASDLGADTRLIRLNDLKFRACEGYYSKAARAFARGLARSRKWTLATSWSASMTPSCTGRTRSSLPRRFAGARHRHS